MKELLTKKTQAIYDHQFFLALQDIPIKEWMVKPNPLDCKEEYLKRFDQLIHLSQENTVEGLERFESHHLIHGTTQAFDEAYLRYSGRRLRLLRGEYAYHKRVNPDFCFFGQGEEPLRENDYIIISFPFCSTGDLPENFNDILNECEKLGVPVEVDCAYFGTCTGLNFNLGHQAIKAVSFSLSKSMGLGDIRSGIRYSNYSDAMPIAQQNSYNHLPLMSAKIGLYMMSKFDFDYIPRTYRKHQLAVCSQLDLKATPCMHLALGQKEGYSDYLVDDKYFRVGLRDLVKAHKKGELA
jgi:hypothetical protein